MLNVLMLITAVAAGSAANTEYVTAMAAEHGNDTTQAGAFADLQPAREIQTREVNYFQLGDRQVSGYLATPVQGNDLPGIIVIHEWWGLNDNIRHMADLLAGHGYTALAVDLYRGEVAETPEDARTLMSQATDNRADILANLRAAYEYLTELQGAPTVGTIGWCFGGGWSLEAALLMPEKVDATVIYYGRVTDDRERLARLELPILGLFGAEDTGIPVDSVEAFEATLEELDKDAEIVIYEGAGHAFANPTGNRYQPEAAGDAWQRTLKFFDENLK